LVERGVWSRVSKSCVVGGIAMFLTRVIREFCELKTHKRRGSKGRYNGIPHPLADKRSSNTDTSQKHGTHKPESGKSGRFQKKSSGQKL